MFFLGARPTKRDAGKINFRAVHVVAQVAAHEPCRSASVDCFEANSGGHCQIWTRTSFNGTPSAQELVRKDTGAGRWDAGQDQERGH